MIKTKLTWIVFITILASIIIFLIWYDYFSFLNTNSDKLFATAFVFLIAQLFIFAYKIIPYLLEKITKFDFWKIGKKQPNTIVSKQQKDSKDLFFMQAIKFIYDRYGLFWRYKVRKCLVYGNKADVDKVLPNLPVQQWQVADKTLMIYAGDIKDEVNSAWFLSLRKQFSRWIPFFAKPIDGLIWVLPTSYFDKAAKQQAAVENAMMQFHARNKLLKWSAPLYVVSNQFVEQSQQTRTEQSVGVLFSNLRSQSVTSVDSMLQQLAKSCCVRGVQQIKQNPNFTALLKLSQDLVKFKIAKINHFLTACVSFAFTPNLRAVFFSFQPANESMIDDASPFFEHSFVLSPTWQSISDDAYLQLGKRQGIQWATWFLSGLMGLMGIYSLLLITSYFKNASLIDESVRLVKLNDALVNDDYLIRLEKQYQLQQLIAQLIYREQKGAPLFYRFGLNHNDALLAKIWLSYRVTNSHNIATPFVTNITAAMSLLTELSVDDPRRKQLVDHAYDILKAYLMLANPTKTEGEYLSQFALQVWPAPKGISEGDWQRLMPELVLFWGQTLKSHPNWALTNDANLIKAVRQILINKIGVQNAVNTLYQNMIQRASQNYPNQNLNQLLEGLDSQLLFSNTIDVPGVYTRKAWEDTIKNEIAESAKSRQEQIDWVLSDNDNQLISSISPEVLKKQLTDRYFSEYSAAWLHFLNTIQWHQADNVSDVIEQLTILADTRQSPLIALMNVVKYQSEVALTGNGISDNLIRSAQEIIGNKSKTGLPKNSEASGPLTATFSPLNNLLKNDNTNGLSLQTYLLRVTQVRLKLQNVANSYDPQGMMQNLAKSVFKGTSVDLTETRDYGNLIAANLGEEWLGFGQNLFKQPLEQSWQVVLTPAAKSFNALWGQYIVSQWEKSFAGRYPFKNSDNDASLAELARFIRSDTGLIDRFIRDELSGVLEKKGGVWVVNNTNAHGLHFSAKFLDALNLFNELSNESISTGDVSLSFELMPRSGHKIVRSELMLNKQKLEYMNQEPNWTRFTWPDTGYTSNSQLSWSSDQSGLHLYRYFQGDWAWIRLLELASVKQLDSSRYQLIWSLPNQQNIKYILRTQLGQGPLTLLKLRHFKLPETVFEL